ncbi:MAG TPA: hypothetical protein VFX98_16140 [Longimicrobiaceae bacterium]|nr:hypothetical protein [Longimicrobiaceae bacterium]
MKRTLLVLALALPAAACDEAPNVVVRAALERGGEPIAGMPVRLLPYDRRALLDSLAREFGRPEPALPQEVLQRLRSLEAGEAPVNQPGDSTPPVSPAAEREALLRQVRAAEAARRAWADSAYADFEEIVQERLADLGLGEQVDTTDASGRAAFAAGAGQWWVFARYVLPDTELEWNVAVTIQPDSAIVPLTLRNARARPFF